MTSPRVTAAAVLVLAALAFGGAQWWRPTQRLADMRAKVVLEDAFPKRFGEWEIDDRMPPQLVSPDIQQFIDKIYNQTLSRVYINRAGDRVMLSVAYGGDQSDATRTHRPEVCYPAQGFQIISSREANLLVDRQTLRARQLIARMGGRSEPITYWVMVGERVAVSGTEQKVAQLAYTTRGVIPDGMLVRVSTIDADAERAFKLQAGFLNGMASALSPQSRPLVVGRAQL